MIRMVMMDMMMTTDEGCVTAKEPIGQLTNHRLAILDNLSRDPFGRIPGLEMYWTNTRLGDVLDKYQTWRALGAKMREMTDRWTEI